MLIMVERGVRGGICHAVKRYAIANNKYMKDYDLCTESSYFMCRMSTIYMDGQCHKSCLQIFLTQKFIKIYDGDDNNKDYIVEVDISYPKCLQKMYFPFLSERIKIEKCQKLVYNMYDKINYLVHKNPYNRPWIMD